MSSATTRPRLPLPAILLAVALVLLFAASEGLALQRISNGEVPEGTEGDPIDSNDYGGGSGSGSGDDVEDSSAIAPMPRLPVFRFGDLVVVIVPDWMFGRSGFAFHVVDSGMPAGEGPHAQ